VYTAPSVFVCLPPDRSSTSLQPVAVCGSVCVSLFVCLFVVLVVCRLLYSQLLFGYGVFVVYDGSVVFSNGIVSFSCTLHVSCRIILLLKLDTSLLSLILEPGRNNRPTDSM
jgi:hypothetical protein